MRGCSLVEGLPSHTYHSCIHVHTWLQCRGASLSCCLLPLTERRAHLLLIAKPSLRLGKGVSQTGRVCDARLVVGPWRVAMRRERASSCPALSCAYCSKSFFRKASSSGHSASMPCRSEVYVPCAHGKVVFHLKDCNGIVPFCRHFLARSSNLGRLYLLAALLSFVLSSGWQLYLLAALLCLRAALSSCCLALP